MYVEKLTGKTEVKVTEADKIKKDHGKNIIKSVLTDDGGEFKGNFDKFLKEEKITHYLTLPGQPQANGMVERSNGKLKMILAKYRDSKGGGWSNNLISSVDIYNQQLIRATGYSPIEALKLKGSDLQRLRDNVKEA